MGVYLFEIGTQSLQLCACPAAGPLVIRDNGVSIAKTVVVELRLPGKFL